MIDNREKRRRMDTEELYSIFEKRLNKHLCNCPLLATSVVEEVNLRCGWNISSWEETEFVQAILNRKVLDTKTNFQYVVFKSWSF